MTTKTIETWKPEWGTPRDGNVPRQVHTPPVIKTGGLPRDMKSPAGRDIGEIATRDIPIATLEMRERIRKAKRAKNKALRQANRMIRTIRL